MDTEGIFSPDCPDAGAIEFPQGPDEMIMFPDSESDDEEGHRHQQVPHQQARPVNAASLHQQSRTAITAHQQARPANQQAGPLHILNLE